jgi:hypothetical protein
MQALQRRPWISFILFPVGFLKRKEGSLITHLQSRFAGLAKRACGDFLRAPLKMPECPAFAVHAITDAPWSTCCVRNIYIF